MRPSSLFVPAFIALLVSCAGSNCHAQTAPDWVTAGKPSPAVSLTAAGKFAEAIPVAQADLAEAEKRLGPNHPDLMEKIELLGTIYTARGSLRDAETTLKRSIAIGEQSLGPRHPQTIEALNKLMAVYAMGQRFDEVEALMKRIGGTQ